MISYITTLTDDNFDNFIKSSNFAIVDVMAQWCGPCQTISPIIDEVSSEYNGRISVGKMDVDNCSMVVSNLGIRNIPAILFYQNGEIVDKIIGAVSKKTIIDIIDKHLSNVTQ